MSLAGVKKKDRRLTHQRITDRQILNPEKMAITSMQRPLSAAVKKLTSVKNIIVFIS
jgi:hypothetical protein